MLRLSELCSELFRRQSLKTQLVWQFLVGISWKIPNKALSRIIYVKCQNWANGDLSDKITPWKNCSVFFSILIGHFFFSLKYGFRNQRLFSHDRQCYGDTTIPDSHRQQLLCQNISLLSFSPQNSEQFAGTYLRITKNVNLYIHFLHF